jgi:hypothetical protein
LNFPVPSTIGKALSNRSNLIDIQLASHYAAWHRISHIIVVRSEIEMIRANTRRIIARMQDE